MLIYGINPLKELIKNNPSLIKEVFIDKKRHQNLVGTLISMNLKVSNYRDFKDFKDINTQGIVIELFPLFFDDINSLMEKLKEKSNSKIIILDQIFDPHNFGAIIRNAVAFEADAIVFSNIKNSPFNGTVIKASAGTWLNINLCETNSIANALNVLKKNEYWIVSTTLEGDKNISDLKKFANDKLAIILGSEGSGIRKSIQKNSDIKLRIDISKKAESLNVSVTSALILYELYNGGK